MQIKMINIIALHTLTLISSKKWANKEDTTEYGYYYGFHVLLSIIFLILQIILPT